MQNDTPLHALRRWLGIVVDNSPWTEKVLSGIGAFLGIYAILLVARASVDPADVPLIVASMGASAVLLFAAPHVPFSQPWNVLAGHGFSAGFGVAAATWIDDPLVSASVAVGGAISLMYFLRCLHPPGGASALMAVIGGAKIHGLGFDYVLFPVMLNALVIFAVALAFNYPFPWRRYPAAIAPKPELPPTAVPTALAESDLDYALAHVRGYHDIDEDDLAVLFHLAREHAETHHLPPEAIRPGRCYSNGALGPEWSIRCVQRIDGDQVSYFTPAGAGALENGEMGRELFARWARFPVRSVGERWVRIDQQ